MSGICGIIEKKKAGYLNNYSASLALMLDKLGCSNSQPSQSKIFSNSYFGNVTLLSDVENINYIFNEELGIYCVIEGLVYVSQEYKSIIDDKYQIDLTLPDKQYLPYLLAFYGTDFIDTITGWYNIFFLDTKSDKKLLINDRLGYLPLFVYESPEVFVFSSKIESILASGIMPVIEFDVTSIVEHLFFNYIISDNTFIKQIKTLEPASLIQFNSEDLDKKEIYWNFKELYSEKPINKEESIDLLDTGLKLALRKLNLKKGNSANLSLTGGWDSRVVLSYLMSDKKQLHLYSFGAKNSTDITIPQYITSEEDILYTPFLLDKRYLENDFLAKAKKTILYSNGCRHYKRAHYIHAIEQISDYSDTIVSGIYGDEVLKITSAKPGDVISKNSLDFIASDFNLDLLIQQLIVADLWKHIPLKQIYIDEFAQRMINLKQSVATYANIHQKYYHFRFLISLRKYFGAEISSYNDYCYNFSPFIDFDFLSIYFKSYFCGIYYPYNSNSLLLKKQSTALYCELVSRNNKKLANYQTDRGYSMADTRSFKGMYKIMKLYILRKKDNTDAFNTKATNNIFRDTINSESSVLVNATLPISQAIITEGSNASALSLFYWLSKISARYMKKDSD
jgi:hypothetical protein